MGGKKLHRRTRGTGSVYRRGGRWVGKVPNGRGATGKVRYKHVTADTKEECERLMRGPPVPAVAAAGAEVTVGQWAQRWLGTLAVRPSTRAMYELAVRHVTAALGARPLSAVAVSDVRDMLTGWLRAGGGTMAPTTANQTLRIARIMSKAAVVDGVLARDPFALCAPVKYDRPDLDPFTAAELRAFVGAWDRHPWCPLFATAACTGLRSGELRALDVGDWTGAALKVTKTDTRHGIGPPKSRQSRRTVPAPAALVPRLRALARRKGGPLFRYNGERFGQSDVFYLFTKLCAELGIRRRKFHCLRHGFITLLVAGGTPLGDVARHVGHTVAELVKTYLHASNSDVGAAVSELFP